MRTASQPVLGLDNCEVLFEFRTLYIDVYIIGQSFLKFLILFLEIDLKGYYRHHITKSACKCIYLYYLIIISISAILFSFVNAIRSHYSNQ